MIKNLSYVLFGVSVFASCQDSKEIIFEDHFNSEELNASYWNYDLGDGCPNLCGWGNNERQIYTKENINLKDGYLIITATNDSINYRSGRITTKEKVEFQYGTIEVKAKLAEGHGLWPAIWMLGNDIDTNAWPGCGEIDIMEYIGKEPNTIYTSLHTPDSYGNTLNSKKTINENIEKGFHIYKTTWTEDKIEFYIDNDLAYSFSPVEKTQKTWPFNKPFYMLINLAIGGNFGGPDVDDTIFPQEFIIDYVKIYK